MERLNLARPQFCRRRERGEPEEESRSGLVGPRFERVAERFRSVVDRGEALEREIALAAIDEDFDTVTKLEAELQKLDRRLRRVWRELTPLRAKK